MTVARSCSDDDAIRYVLPVLWMTSMVDSLAASSKRSELRGGAWPGVGEVCRPRLPGWSCDEVTRPVSPDCYCLYYRACELSVLFAACSVEKTPDKETQVDNNSDVLPQSSSAAYDDDDKSRDRMTSSDSERGDSGADSCQQTAPSVDDAAQTTTTNLQHVTASLSDGTVPPTADRKEKSDEPETSSASSGALWFEL